MTAPPAPKQRPWPWLAAAGWTFAILVTIPLARAIQAWVQAHGHPQLLLWITLAALGLAAGWIAMAAFRGRVVLRPKATAAICAVGAAMAALGREDLDL